MNEINVRNEILGSIDNVNDVTMESTLDVMGSLALAYDKAAMITEYSNAEDLSMFSIFQEAEVAEAKKEPGLGMKILMFIPNILRKIWEFLKQAWNGEIVPTAKKAAKEAENLSDKLKGIFNKIIGKDESWIRENAGVLGISGAALALVLGVAAWFNKDNLKNLITNFINGISAFFKKTGDRAKEYGIIFEMVVWNKFKTNISFKGLKDAITSIPEFFKKCKEFHIRNINPLVNSADSLKPNPSQMLEDLSNLEKEMNQISAADIIVEDIAELSGPEIIDGFTLTDPTTEVGQKLNESLQETAKVMTLTEEQVKKFAAAFPVAEDQNKVKGILSKIGSWLQSVAKAFFGMLKSAKDFCVNFIKKIKDARDIDKSLDYGKSDSEEPATKDSNPGNDKAATDDLTSNLEEDSTATYPAQADGAETPEELGLESTQEEIPEGEEAVQESATEDEAEAAINNHWYR